VNHTAFVRVSVVGTSGSGKTSFARKLAEILEVPCIELDALHWGPDWTVRSSFRSEVAAAVQQPAWVIDGNYGHHVRDLVWGRCTAIVWLDFDFWITFGRGVWRTFKRIVTRERLYSGNRESLRKALLDPEGVPLWIIRSYRRRKRETALLASQPGYAHATFVVLRSPAEAARFLESLRRPPAW
jgi:adenylate kinase family enzyme